MRGESISDNIRVKMCLAYARERDGDGSKSADRLLKFRIGHTLALRHAALSGVSRGDAAGTKQAEHDGETRENGDQSYFETR